MQKIFIFSLLIISTLSNGQNIDEILEERSLKTDSLTIEMQKLNIQDEQVIYLQKARETLKTTANDILKLENFNNKIMQKALMKPLLKYYDAFNIEKDGKITNTLGYGDKSKEDFIYYHYKIPEALLLTKLIEKQYYALISYDESNIKILTNYINNNLKRLGITREQYEKLSENDKKLLEKKFE